MLPFVVGLVGTVALLALGIATGQPNWQVYLAVLVLGTGGAALLHRAVGLSPPTVWGLLLFGLGHLAGGMVPVAGVHPCRGLRQHGQGPRRQPRRWRPRGLGHRVGGAAG